ncbi:ABC transporter ATP-binding protein [Microvirga arvi]|uniref:ABC transporter ATP-binding protein n=1 Tax=Microvirga arvi TaxID=2778731 RepID=UPI003558516B
MLMGTLRGTPLLSVRDLSVQFRTDQGLITAVDGVSFDLRAGQTLGIVGESGSGKSVTAMSLLRLLPPATTRIARGEILLEGRDIIKASESELERIRGRDVSIVFQDPMSSLNPVLTIGRQICEPLRLHLKLSRAEAKERAVDLLGFVGIPSPRESLGSYPHQLSGGQRQRVVIAMALACRPKVLIADEPTTALDVTTQAQILDLLRELQSKLHMAVILITHDLGVVAEFADDVLVMYAGRMVEKSPVSQLFARARHPYTQGLLNSIPPFGDQELEKLPAINGTVPSPFAMPSGCAFHPRCTFASSACLEAVPELASCGPNHVAACLRVTELERMHA